VDGFQDGSGLFGVAGSTAAAEQVAAGLGSLQHRGAAGVAIASADGRGVRSTRARGAVHQLSMDGLSELPGTLAIGQVHGGLGNPDLAGLPLDGGDRMVLGTWSGGELAAALAGRFTNGTRLRRELKAGGALFQTESDAEVLLHLIAQSRQTTVVNRVVDALWRVEGAFSLVLLGAEILVAVRDPRGFRPLVVGQNGGALVVASEDVAIRAVGGQVQRSVAPGEMIVVDRGAVQSVRPFPPQPASPCAQELIGLSRHDARLDGRAPYTVRTTLGERLGQAAPCAAAERVLALPRDEPYALGYARVTGLPYERALVSAWSGHADDWMVVPAVVEGKRVVLVSRSLLTGAEVREAVTRILAAGALDVHVRIATPPIKRACSYGVPSPTTDELASARREAVDELALWLDAASVDFLSLEALEEVLGDGGWCTGCLSGTLPVVPEEPDDQLPLF
jgi:amidophosphoribosyltransferase